MSENPTAPVTPADPTPAPVPVPVPAAPAQPDPVSPPAPPAEEPKLKTDWTAEEATAEIARLRAENKEWRLKLREAEPIVEAHNAAREAAKTEVQRATEQLTAAQQEIADLTREAVAKTFGVPKEDYDLLGSGTREEMEAKGARYQARFGSSSIPTPPPTDRPVESLRPGASSTPPPPADHSYPAAWKP